MSQCKWCSNKGFFLKLTVNGVCEECNPMVVKNILKNGKKYEKSTKKLNNYISPQDGLKLISAIINSLSLLKQYEVKGIPTIELFPSDLLNKKIYGKKDESLYDLEKRLIQENIEIESGVLRLSEIEILGGDVETLNGIFVFDNSLDAYVQQKIKTDSDSPHWTQFAKISLKFSDNHKGGIYREYYESGKLRRETPFIIDKEYDNYLADGIERVYYEDIDSEGNDTYTILEENCYKEMERCGIWKKYSIDGGLMEETNMDTISETDSSLFYRVDRKEYYPETGNLKFEQYKDWAKGYYNNGNIWLEDNKNWGKEYYENGSIKAEWSNKDYMKCGDYKEYHENGEVKMKCKYLDGVNRDGLMHKYFEDGNLKELWSYNKGKRKFVKKYFENGELKTEWLYDKSGNEISKKYYDKDGNKIDGKSKVK